MIYVEERTYLEFTDDDGHKGSVRVETHDAGDAITVAVYGPYGTVIHRFWAHTRYADYAMSMTADYLRETLGELEHGADPWPFLFRRFPEVVRAHRHTDWSRDVPDDDGRTGWPSGER